MTNDPTHNRVIALVAAALLLRFGMELWSSLPPRDALHTVVTIAVYGVGVAIMVLAATDHRWLDQHAHHLGYAGLAAFVLGMVTLYFSEAWSGGFGTDAALYARYSTDLLMAGQDPFAHGMSGALEKYDVSVLHITPRTDGGAVYYHSYPAGSILIYLPQRLLGIGKETLGLTQLAMATGLFALLIHVSPTETALAPLVFVELPRTFFFASLGGILDAYWLLPTAAAFVLLYWDRRWASALIFGIGMSMKQQPWIIAPFALLWVWHTTDGYRESAKYVAGAALAFFAINLPFIAWHPMEWAKGVLTPIYGTGAPMVTQGSGLALLTVNMVYPMTKSGYSVLLICAVLAALVAYAAWFDRLQYAALVVTPAVLFFSYRSLNSYYMMVMPLAYLAALMAAGTLRRPRWMGERHA